jgi:hypothetical protein
LVSLLLFLLFFTYFAFLFFCFGIVLNIFFLLRHLLFYHSLFFLLVLNHFFLFWRLPYLFCFGFFCCFLNLNSNNPITYVFGINDNIPLISDFKLNFRISSHDKSMRVVTFREKYDSLACMNICLIVDDILLFHRVVLVLNQRSAYSLSVNSSYHLFVELRMV